MNRSTQTRSDKSNKKFTVSWQLEIKNSRTLLKCVPLFYRHRCVKDIYGSSHHRNLNIVLCCKWRNYKVIYRRYAGLYFSLCVETTDNELAHLEAIHLFVELLDAFFGNVCELDLVFNFHKVRVLRKGGEVNVTNLCFVGACSCRWIFPGWWDSRDLKTTHTAKNWRVRPPRLIRVGAHAPNIYETMSRVYVNKRNHCSFWIFRLFLHLYLCCLLYCAWALTRINFLVSVIFFSQIFSFSTASFVWYRCQLCVFCVASSVAFCFFFWCREMVFVKSLIWAFFGLLVMLVFRIRKKFEE